MWLASSQRPAQPSQGYNLLFLLFTQDIGHAEEGYKPSLGVNVPGRSSVGRFSADYHWPVLSDH